MNGAGSIWYQLGIDNTQLQRDADKSSKIFRGIGDTVDSEGARIDNIVKRLTSGIAAMGVSLSAGALVKQIVSVRGEFQQLGIAFETMLGSKARADGLMSQLVDTAAKTPFDLTGVANGAKQLLAYGTSAEEVNETLIRLGNIASGLSIPLNDLVYLYGTTQVQGRLFTQDVRQFMGRGIPLVQQLALELGRTEEEINDMVTAGKIGFPEVQRVINNLTNEGGMFFNLMEKQSASITGQIANMQDAWDMMLNDIGSKSEGIFTGAIEITTSLIENYEKVGKVMLGIVAVYGAYKAAVIALSVVENLRYQATLAQMAGMTKMQAITDVLRAKTAALNATMLANPYVLATMAIVALGYAVWALHDATTTQEKAQERLNEITEEARQRKEDLESQTSKLTGIINSETKTIFDQISAYKELQGLYPELLKNMDLQKFKSMSATEQQKLLNQAMNDASEVDLQNTIKNQESIIKNLEKEIKFTSESMQYQRKGSMYYAYRLGQLDKQKKAEEIVLGTLKEQQAEQEKIRKEAEFLALPEEERRKILQNQLTELDKQKTLIESQITSIGGVRSEWQKFNPLFHILNGQLGEILNKIEETKNKLTTNPTTENKSYWEKQKKDATEALEAMTPSDKNSEAWNKQLSIIKEANKNLKTWDFSSKSKSSGTSSAENAAQKRVEAQQWLLNKQKELNNQQIKFALELEQTLLDIDKDSFEKQQKQNELNYRKELLSIKEFEAAKLREQQEVAKQIYVSQKGSDKGFDFTKFDMSSLPIDLQTDNIQKQVEELTNAAQKVYDNANKLASKSEQERIDELLAKHQDYNAKRSAIDKQYQKDLEELNKLPDSEQKNAALAQLEKDRKASIKAVNDEEAAELIKTTDLFVRLFTDASQQSVKQIRKVIDETQALYDYLANTKDEDITANFGFTAEQLKNFKGDAEQLKAILDGLIAKKRELAGKSEFQAFAQSIGDAIKTIQKGGIENIGKGITDIGTAVNQISPQIKEFGNDLANIIGDEKLGEDIGLATDALAGLGSTAAGVGQIMAGDVVGGIKSVVSGVSSLVTVWGKLKDRKKEKEIKRLQEQVDALQKSYEKLGRSIEKAYSQDAVNLIEQQNEALEKQKVLIQQQIKAEEDKKKTDKNRIKEWEQQIEEIDLLIEQNKDKAIDAIFGQDIKSAIEDFADAYVEAWSAGEDRAKASKDFVKKMIKQMVVEAMKADISEPMKKIREKLEQFWQDGFISANEEDIINHMVEQLDKELSDKYAWADKYLDSNEGNRNSTAKGVATASQDSVDEMNGRFSVIQSHTYELNENVKILRANSSAVLKHLAGIESNTANTNTRLELVEAAIIAVSSGIDAINLHGIILKK